MHSALKGISSGLENVLQVAIAGDPSEQLAAIREQHIELAEALRLNGKELLGDAFFELIN